MHALSRKCRILYSYIAIIIVIVSTVYFTNRINIETPTTQIISRLKIKLPDPVYSSKISIEEALKRRRSAREYNNEPITLHQISQLLWAAQGITSPNGFRTAPSAGALYPLHVYLGSANVKDLPSGIYRYLPTEHSLELLTTGDLRAPLAVAAFDQSSIKTAAAAIVIAAVYPRTTNKYGDRGSRFVAMEAGHASQNIYLQAVSLKLETVAVGGFDDVIVKKIMNLPSDQSPLYIMPIGRMS